MPYPDIWADKKNHTILHFPGKKYNCYRLTTLNYDYADGWVDEDEAKKLIKKYGMKKMTGGKEHPKLLPDADQLIKRKMIDGMQDSMTEALAKSESTEIQAISDMISGLNHRLRLLEGRIV